MADIKIDIFEGKAPQLNPKRLPNNTAQVATNCQFREGVLQPINGLTKGDLMGGLRVVDLGGQVTYPFFEKIDANTVKVNAYNNGLSENDTITITDTTNYDGNYTATNVATHSFEISATWVFNDGAGSWYRDWIVIQENTGNLTSDALVDSGGDTVTFTTDAVHNLEVGDHVWFDSTVGGVSQYPIVYEVTAVPTTTQFTISAPYVANADPSDSDWFEGDYVVTGEVGSIYLMNDSWLNLAGDTDFAQSYVADNDSRIYYTSASGLRQTDYTLAIQGYSYTWPAAYYRLGVEVPPSAIVGTVTTDATALADSSTSINSEQSCAYVYTYVTGWDEEGAESPPSDVVDIAAGQKVTLTGFDSPLVYSNNIDSVRVYKTVTGTNGNTEYLQINKKGVITGVTDDTGDAVFASATHTLLDGATVLIVGTSEYNGEYTVDSKTANTFKLLDENGDTVEYGSGSSEGDWFQTSDITLADAIANGVVDRSDAEDAGLQLSTEDFDPPPSDLQDIRLFSNNIYAGFNGDNELCLSEPGYPYAWPIKYRIPVAHSVVAVSGYLSTLLVLTDTQPYIVIGTDPSTMTLHPLPYKKPCINNTGVVSTPSGVVYPTYDGLYSVTSSSGTLLTKGIVDRETWESYPLTNMYSTYFDGKYIAFFKDTNIGFYFDFEAPTLRMVDIEFNQSYKFKNMHNDGEDLYLLSTDNYLYKWNDDSDNPLTYTWRSKVFQFLSATNFSVARILNDASGDLQFRMYLDGSISPVHIETVGEDEIFRLPGTSRNKEFVVEVIGTSLVELLQVATDIEGLQ